MSMSLKKVASRSVLSSPSTSPQASSPTASFSMASSPKAASPTSSFSMSAASSPKAGSRKVLNRRDSAAEIEFVLESRGVAPLAEKALSVGEEIGKGKFKRVHKGLLKQQWGGEPREVVIMQYKKQGSELNELSVLSMLAGMHLFVPELFGAVDQRTVVSVVSEYAPYGTLKSALQSPKLASQITLQHKLHMAKKAGLGLDFLQSLRIVHADLACRNLLLFHLDQDPSTACVKITDFGLSIVLDEGSASQKRKQPQATRWCSPETIAFNKYSHQSDIWSLGVSLWELFNDAATPWANYHKRADVTAMLTKLAHHPDPKYSSRSAVLSADFPLPDFCCMHSYGLILECLKVDEETRPTAAQVAERLQGILVVHAISEAAADFSRTDSSEESSNGNADEVGSLASTEASVGSVLSELPVSMRYENPDDECLSNPEEGDVCASKLNLVSLFLWSRYASSVLGDAAVQRMRQEVKQVQQEQKALACGPQEAANAPLRELLLSPRQAEGPLKYWECCQPLSIWTLWSVAENDKLRRQDFGSEAAARAAAKAHGDRTRVLKGPCHEEVYTGMPVAVDS